MHRVNSAIVSFSLLHFLLCRLSKSTYQVIAAVDFLSYFCPVNNFISETLEFYAHHCVKSLVILTLTEQAPGYATKKDKSYEPSGPLLPELFPVSVA